MDGEQTTIEPGELAKSARTSAHKSGRLQRIEVITGVERRRRWSVEQKREIVAESLRPGVKPGEVMRKYGIGSGQFYTWRQQLTRRLDGEDARPAVSFACVDVVTAGQQPERPAPATQTTNRHPAPADAPLSANLAPRRMG